MSHFTVLVTNTNIKSVEEQLERFYEQGDEDDYFMEKQIDVLAGEVEAKAREILNFSSAELSSKYNKAISEGDFMSVCSSWYGGAVDDEGNLYHISNPDAKWDWYQIGGRWAGFFVAKAGRDGTDGVDAIKVKDIDWAAMEQVEKDRRAKRYDEEMAKPEADRFIWEPVARTQTRDEYINASVSNSTFAVLHEDVWYEQGEMGWWGIVSNEVDRDEWDIQFRNLVDSLDPDSEVTVVDCHI